MVVRIYNGEDLRKQFEAYGRDYYSDDAYEALLNYYDNELDDPDMELDVIELCSIWNEYDNMEEVSDDYPDVLDVYEWVRNYYDDADTYANADDEEIDNAIWNGDIDLDDYYRDYFINLEGDTTVIPLDDGSCLVEAF